MKNILLLVHHDDGQEARLQAALDVTRAVEGHLACIDVTPYPVMAGNAVMGFGESVVLFDERGSEAKNKADLTDRLSREDVSWSWADVSGEIATSVLEAADLADLIVLNRALDGYPLPDMRDISSRIIERTSAAVLAVPETLEHFAVDRVLVAWDGGRSAAAALRAAVPILALACEVEIFMAREVIDDDMRNDPETAAAYLSRHGIHAAVKIAERAEGRADASITGESDAWRADLIVMGAYGRGRLRETFGGVTKRMLSDSKLPLLLAH
ncbi:universal stress protein [Sphingopyxis sp.]|uniref:universal stress protein n=1 Tax=Sphingopyxis sp. TaxID=1908224 RepID=UPI0025F9AE1E|nr:universal stress protein [Sphingopyxis sp.]MBK6411635.1 universal stress protein [Sphingopyxis sp.]